MSTKKKEPITDTFVVEGAFPYDGEYDLAVSTLNGYELRFIKETAKVRANELDEALVAGDYDVHIACAVIAMMRTGKVTDEMRDDAFDVLMRQSLGAVYFRAGHVNGKDKDASDPPPETPPA